MPRRIHVAVLELLRGGQPVPVLRVHEVDELLVGPVRVLMRRARRRAAESMVLLSGRAAVALALTACAAGATACGGAGKERASATSGGCAQAVDRPPPPGTFVLDRVFFAGAEGAWRQGARMQASRWSEDERFAKTGLAVRGEVPVVLRVPAEVAASVRMEGWARPGGRVVYKHQDPPGQCSDQVWQNYYGGFVYLRAQCLRLRVEVGRRTETVPFGLGKDC
jgi:hypothetical protein